MPLEKIALQRIEAALAAGEFDNLPGRGKPLNLDDHFRTPEHLRMAYSILKSAGFLPEEVELLRELAALRTSRDRCADGQEKDRLQRLIRDKDVRLRMLLERLRRSPKRA